MLVLATLALPAVKTAAAETTLGDRERNGDRFVTGVPERSRPTREVRRAQSSAGASLAALMVGDDYFDECDDTAAADIAKFIIGDDLGANVGFGWATCNGKPMRYTEAELVVFSIDRDIYDPDFAHDFVVAQWMDGYYEVYRSYNSAPPDGWTLIDYGYGQIDRSHPGRTIGSFIIDAVTTGFPYEYDFAFQTFDASGERDIIPNPGHLAPSFPSGCDTFVFRRKAVVRTDDLDAAIAAAQAAGLRVESVAPGIGTFTISPVERLTDVDLPGQTRLTRPTAHELVAVNDPEPSQWAIDQLGLERAWAAQPSARVEIAVVDSGVDSTRPDLAGRVAAGFDAVTGRLLPAGANSAFHPHGTAVSGIAAGTRNNGREVAGVNSGAIIRPYRVTGHNGPCVESGALAAALDHIATVDSIRIVNMSLGSPAMDPSVRDAVKRVAAKGKVLVAASGNDGAGGPRANYPASLPEVIGVGATGPGPEVARYSQPANAEFVAPGGVGTSRADAIATLGEWDGVEYGTGTSYAAPYVAGALSLWLNGNRATTDQARVALRGSATDLPGTTDDGHGLVNVPKLLGIAAKDYPTPQARDVVATCDDKQASRFADVAGDTHEYMINCVAGWNITSGKTSTTYDPAGLLTRGQTATFLVRTLEAAGVAVPAPTDVCSETDVHAANLERLVAAKIVPAPADHRCLTSASITREVMALWTRGALAVGGVTITLTTDWYSDDDASPYQDQINEITTLGIVTGKGGALYAPTSTLTRAQMATFLARTLDALRA